MKTIIQITLLAGLFACNDPKEKKAEQIIEQGDSTKRISEMQDGSEFPIDKDLPASLITHEGSEDDLQKKWLGLFTNGKRTYLQETKIKLTPFDNGIYDGYEALAAQNADSLIILISGLDFLTEHVVEHIDFNNKKTLFSDTHGHPNALEPGDSLTYTFKGVTYLIYVIGKKDEASGYFINYKSFLRTTINGKASEELLFSCSSSGDEIASLVFLGDIDDDGIPDLILANCVGGYQANRTLYLSKPSDRGHLLKVVGSETWGGC